MKKYTILLALAAWVATSSFAAALDIVKRHKGVVNGQVTKVSPLAVEIEANQIPQSIPVNDIEAVNWDGEPSQLKTARQHIKDANYQSALQAMEKLTLPANARDQIRQDIEFYTAYCKAQMALGGQGEIKDAGSAMANFVKNNPGSYHWLQANEVVGDLLTAMGVYDKAMEYYAPLGKTEWPDYKMRSGVAIGRALLAQNQVEKAQQQFQAVLALKAEGDLATAQRQAAELGNARCLAAQKKTDEAIKIIEGIIAKADPESSELLGQAYNALGTAYRAANKKKEALMAFLHVDLIYFMQPDAHAEALANLVTLWKEDNKPEREQKCLQTLESRYPNSPWNKKKPG